MTWFDQFDKKRLSSYKPIYSQFMTLTRSHRLHWPCKCCTERDVCAVNDPWMAVEDACDWEAPNPSSTSGEHLDRSRHLFSCGFVLMRIMSLSLSHVPWALFISASKQKSCLQTCICYNYFLGTEWIMFYVSWKYCEQ